MAADDGVAPPPPMAPHTAGEFVFARRTLKKTVLDSHFFPPWAAWTNWSRTVLEGEIEYGAILGHGGFCEVRLATLAGDRGREQSPRRYAMKYISPAMHSVKDEFERGIADLAIEARFLALLSHANIIELHYVSAGSLAEQFNCAETAAVPRHRFGLVLLLDPLRETLAARIDGAYIPRVFAQRDGAAPPPPDAPPAGGWWRRRAAARKAARLPMLASWRVQLARRLEGLRGIAAALEYLHDDCRVVYRDCKPDNIGFYRPPGAGGAEVPKLFDFGLAKELKPRLLKAHPHHEVGRLPTTYRLTARTGSQHYMAPEVAFATPYNEKADVYSFGIVLYQVASLVTPFEDYSLCRHVKEVLYEGGRPDVKIPVGRRALGKVRKSAGLSHEEWLRQDDVERQAKQLGGITKCVWTADLKRLTEECWHDDMRKRPSMREVGARLECCIRELASEGLPKSLVQETECRSSWIDNNRCGHEGMEGDETAIYAGGDDLPKAVASKELGRPTASKKLYVRSDTTATEPMEVSDRSGAVGSSFVWDRSETSRLEHMLDIDSTTASP